MSRTRAVLTLVVALVALTLPAAPAAAWKPKLPSGLVKKLQRDLAPLKATEAAWKSYVNPARDVPGAPPPGSLGATPRQIAASNVVGDPAYWQAWWERLINPTGATITLPWPADLVKPELILPIAAVPKGAATWPLQRAPQDIGAVTYTYNGEAKTVERYLRTTETDALVFLRDGAIVAEAYANGYSATHAHQPWSVTKSFVSTLVGIARDEGLIASVQDPIERYIPELAPTAWAGTTIRNILEMESGMEWDEGTVDLKRNTQVLQWRDLWLDYITNGRAGRDRNEFLMRLRRLAPQGEVFAYNSGNTQVLAWLLEEVYGRPFAQIASEKLWQPLGMEADASIITDRHGRAIASQGLYAVPYDLARFGELFRNGGRTPDGRQIVSEAWVEEATNLAGPENRSNGEYAYQWWINPADAEGYRASGFQGNYISVSPSWCTVSVRMGHTLGLAQTPPEERAETPTRVELGDDEYHAMLAAVLPALGGCSAPTGAEPSPAG